MKTITCNFGNIPALRPNLSTAHHYNLLPPFKKTQRHFFSFKDFKYSDINERELSPSTIECTKLCMLYADMGPIQLIESIRPMHNYMVVLYKDGIL